MISKSAHRDVLCRVGNKILVRFKDRKEREIKAKTKRDDFNEDEAAVCNSKFTFQL